MAILTHSPWRPDWRRSGLRRLRRLLLRAGRLRHARLLSTDGTCCWAVYAAESFRGRRILVGRGDKAVWAPFALGSVKRVPCGQKR